MTDLWAKYEESYRAFNLVYGKWLAKRPEARTDKDWAKVDEATDLCLAAFAAWWASRHARSQIPQGL